MPFKTPAPTHEFATSDPHDIILEIEGLIANSDGTFVLRGVKPVDLDYKKFEEIQNSLIEQGVPRMVAVRLAEEASHVIHTGLLADALAQRTRRVG